MKLFKYTLVTYALLASGILTSCLNDGDSTFIVTQGNATDIPDDSKASKNPEIADGNAYIPNIQYTTVNEDGTAVIRLDMTGIQNPNTGEWMRLAGTGDKDQNVWVEVDGKPKGITVYNTADGNNERVPKIDLVFLVDNSGSMNEEANTIARDIIKWSEQLEISGIDIRFGCVGYDGEINGAINLTSATMLSDYLNRYTGTRRTVGFGGEDAEILKQNSGKYYLNNSWDECGVAALRMANDNFAFRSDANRIYVNFTDEANASYGKPDFSVEYVNDQTKWTTASGTIHTVFSNNKAYCGEEYPWLLSTYTGGTVIYTDSSFTGVSLSSLPVTGAMQNSYIIRFTNIKEFMDGQLHTIHITILSKDGTVRAERVFSVVFKPEE